MVKLKKWFKTHLNVFLVALLVPCIVFLGAWSTDDNGNLVSDNLINNNVDTEYGNGTLFNATLESNTTYTLSFISNNNGDISVKPVIRTQPYLIFNSITNVGYNYYTFTTDVNYSNPTNNIYFYTSNNLIATELCLVKGNIPQSWQPYGSTFYSQSNYEQLEDSLEQLNQSIGNISFNIVDYGVSVGNVPNQISFDYTFNQVLSNNFTNLGYLNISTIYTNFIASGGGSTNNTIYIDTPVNNLLTFDMQFNFNNQPNVTIKTFLNLPNGTTNNFVFSADDFDYKENWSLSNFVAVSTIANSYDLNDISYQDIMITYNNVGDTLSSIKLGNNNGYNTGFENGYNKGLAEIEFWKLQYNQLNSDYNNLSSVVESLQNQVTQLNEQLNNTIGWKPFIFTMADTPFRVVSNLLGFEVFGVNLYKVLVGLITTLAILWLIRKLRR